MSKRIKFAADLHHRVPANWYHASIKRNLLQKFWHQTRFREVSQLIKPVKEKVLDIGCADGVFTRIILEKTKAQEIIGIDILKTSIAWARKHWRKNKKMKFQLGDAHKLEFKAQTFDAVFMLEALEHVQDPNQILREIKRVLKKDGYTIILVPTENRLFEVIWFLWTKFGPGRIWDDCHLQSFKNDCLVSLLLKNGFKIQEKREFLLGMLQVIRAGKR